MADTIQWNQQPFAKGKVYLTISTLLKSAPSLVEIVNLDLGLKDRSWKKKTIKKEMKSNRTLLDIRKKNTQTFEHVGGIPEYKTPFPLPI